MPAAFTCADLTTYYQLEETDTSSVRVDSKGASDLTCINSAAAASGIIGNAASYSGTHFLRSASVADLTFDSNVAFSIALWFYLPSSRVGQPLVWKGNGVTSLTDYEYRINTAGSVMRFAVTDGSGGHQGVCDTTTTWSTSAWTFLAAWYDGANLNCSFDDGTVTSVAYTWGSWNGSHLFGLGGVGGSGDQLDSGSLIDEASLWRGYAFTAGDITALYNGGAGLGYSSICASALAFAGDMRGGFQRGMRGGFVN